MVETCSKSRQSFEANDSFETELTSFTNVVNSLKLISHEELTTLVEQLEFTYLELFMIFEFKDLRDPSVKQQIEDGISKFDGLVFEIDGSAMMNFVFDTKRRKQRSRR